MLHVIYFSCMCLYLPPFCAEGLVYSYPAKKRFAAMNISSAEIVGTLCGSDAQAVAEVERTPFYAGLLGS